MIIVFFLSFKAQDIAAEKARYIADLEEENRFKNLLSESTGRCFFFARMLRESLASISPHSVISPPPPPLRKYTKNY